MLFPTKKKAEARITERYGYVRTRKDLRAEPHGWRMPKAIRVEIIPAPSAKGAVSAQSGQSASPTLTDAAMLDEKGK
jgi:hypothetical protein